MCVFRWLRGKDFDVAAEFDKIARFHNESDDCMAELLKGTDSKEKKYGSDVNQNT